MVQASSVVRRPLAGSRARIFNLDKLGSASDLSSIKALPQAHERHLLLKLDQANPASTAEAVQAADPHLVFHLVAESHSIARLTARGLSSRATCWAPSSCCRRCGPTGKSCQQSGERASVSTTSAPMRYSAPWAPRAASRKPPPTQRIFDQQGRQRPPGERLELHLWPAGNAHQLAE